MCLMLPPGSVETGPPSRCALGAPREMVAWASTSERPVPSQQSGGFCSVHQQPVLASHLQIPHSKDLVQDIPGRPVPALSIKQLFLNVSSSSKDKQTPNCPAGQKGCVCECVCISVYVYSVSIYVCVCTCVYVCVCVCTCVYVVYV